MNNPPFTANGSHFLNVAPPLFQYLCDEFGYRKLASKSRSTYHVLTYKGNKTAITINFDIREQYIYVEIIRLIGHKIPPLFYREDGEGGEVVVDTQNYFSLLELLLRISPASVKEIELPEYGLSTNAMTNLLVHQAALLREYGGRILAGDFGEFDADGYTDRRYIRSPHPPYSYVRNESA